LSSIKYEKKAPVREEVFTDDYAYKRERKLGFTGAHSDNLKIKSNIRHWSCK